MYGMSIQTLAVKKVPQWYLHTFVFSTVLCPNIPERRLRLFGLQEADKKVSLLKPNRIQRLYNTLQRRHQILHQYHWRDNQKHAHSKEVFIHGW